MQLACHSIHGFVSKLPRLSKNLIEGNLPKNGLYFVFENGEFSHSQERIVRIGTHTGDGNLQKRIGEHLYTAKKDRSIFRKHIGRCILSKRNDSFLEYWEKDLTTKSAREKFESVIDFSYQAKVEVEVTDYINENMSVAVIEISDKKRRLFLEKALLSTIAQCPECSASINWLGRFYPQKDFRDLGLWNVHGLKGKGLSVLDVKEIFGFKFNPIQHLKIL